MDKHSLVYFVNSQGRKTVLSSPENRNFWELRGRRGFAAADVDLFTQKFASGRTKFFGKTLKPRPCSLQIICKGKDTAELDRLFGDMLETLLDNGSNQEGTLYLRRSDGTPVHLSCVYSGGMNVEQQYRRFRVFNVEFYAADPLFYYDKVFEIEEGQLSNEVAFQNETGGVIWPEIHLRALPTGTVSQDPFFRLQYAIWLNLVKDPTYYGVNPEYYNISIYTDPDKRGAFGDRVINGNRTTTEIPEILADPDILKFFSIREGLNHLDYAGMAWDYGTPGGTIVLPNYKTYLGA